MTRREVAMLQTILAKVEALQHITNDREAKDRLGLTKDELLRLYSRCQS